MSSTTNLENKELAKDITERAMNSIQNEIQSQIIEVSQKKLNIDTIIQLKKETKVKRKKQGKHVPTFDQLNQIKHEKILELRQIEKKADEMKKQQLLSKSKTSKSCNRLWKSEFTDGDISQIKRIMKKQRQYQIQLKKKQKNLEDWVNEKRLQDQQLKKQQLNEKCQYRKKELAKQRLELQKKKQQRTFLLQQEIKKIKQNKGHKLLYLQMSQSWKRYEETSQKQRQKLWQMEKQKRAIDAKLIHQHQTKYLQKKKEQEQKRQKILEQSHFRLPYIHSHCQLFHQVQQQQQDQIRQKEMKIRQIQENVSKRLEYGRHLKEQIFFSKPKQVYDAKQKQGQKSKGKSPLKLQQQHKLGNNYMKTIHQKVTKQDLEKMKNSLKIPQKAGGISINYKNYLKDVKPRQKENKEGIETIQKTLNNMSMDEIDKLHKVKMIFEKDQRTKKSDTEWFETLKSKMNVLSKLMN